MPSTLIPYSASEEDLFKPAAKHSFFPTGRPASDAALCAEMSRLAYASFETPAGRKIVQDSLAAIGFNACESNFFVADRAKGYLATSDRLAVLAFRGTEASNVRDLLTDFDTVSIPWAKGGVVHQGFSEAILEIWPGVAKALDAVAQREIVYTGHSLGAALATLAASLRKPSALYTIGSPRVGDANFVRTLAGLEAERFEDCCDLVCHVPPHIMGFEHYGNLSYINMNGAIEPNAADGTLKHDQMHARWKYFREYAFRSGNVMVRDLADHAPINYVSALMELRAQ